jgi:SH3 domain-containing YSC84-like protein 1
MVFFEEEPMERRKGNGTTQLGWSGGVTIMVLLALVALFRAPALADDALEARHLAEKARFTLETFGEASEMEAFRSLIKNAQGVFVAPTIVRGAWFFGGSGGNGVFLARDNKLGRWTGPAFYSIGQASIGFQWGVDASEVILLAMTNRGVNALLKSSVKLGADAGVAAGPVGLGAAASTANLSADIISFARSKGLYLGISLDGALIKTRSDLNNAFYGAAVTPTDILAKQTADSGNAATLLETVSRLAQRTGTIKAPPGPRQETTKTGAEEE